MFCQGTCREARRSVIKSGREQVYSLLFQRKINGECSVNSVFCKWRYKVFFGRLSLCAPSVPVVDALLQSIAVQARVQSTLWGIAVSAPCFPFLMHWELLFWAMLWIAIAELGAIFSNFAMPSWHWDLPYNWSLVTFFVVEEAILISS